MMAAQLDDAAYSPLETALPPSEELLAHYKARIDAFEAERAELRRAVDRCAVSAADLHKAHWEARARADEARELQAALSDASQLLFEERGRLLALQAENDELRLAALDDRAALQRALGGSGGAPLGIQAVEYSAAGALPTVVAATAAAAAPASAKRQAKAGGGGKGGGGVLRTVLLPSGGNPEALLLKIEALEAQLQEQRALADERVEALLADRQLRQQEEERRRATAVAAVEALSERVEQLEDALRQATRDFLDARNARDEAEARAVAAEARAAADADAVRADASRRQRAAVREAQDEAAAREARLREYAGRFRAQARAKEEELAQVSAQHAADREAAEARIAELEARAARLADANRALELRRRLEADGWQADVAILRKAVAAVDRKLTQMRLIDRLEDDERLDALLGQLHKKAPPVPLLQKQAQRSPRKKRASSGGGRRLHDGRDASSSAVRDGGGGGGDSSSDGGDNSDDDDEGSRGFGGGGGGGDGSAGAPCTADVADVRAQLEAEMRAVRRQLEALDARAADKVARAKAGARPLSARARSASRALCRDLQHQ